jgi:hypothetical protein
VPCDQEQLGAWITRIQALPRGLAAPCGSTKLKRARYGAGETDLPHPTAVTGELTLDVYAFETKHPPGSGECEKNR